MNTSARQGAVILLSMAVVTGCGGPDRSSEAASLTDPLLLSEPFESAPFERLNTFEPKPFAKEDACGVDNAIAELARRCGRLKTVYLSASGRLLAAGAYDDPVGTVRTALEACGDVPCHIKVGAGEFPMPITELKGCIAIDGGYDERTDRPWARGLGRSVLSGDDRRGPTGDLVGLIVVRHGVLDAVQTADVILAGLDFRARVQGLSVQGYEGDVSKNLGRFALLNSTVSAALNPVSFLYSDAQGRICGSELSGGETGLAVSRFEGALEIASSTVQAQKTAVNIWAWSRNIRIEGSALKSPSVGLAVSLGSEDVSVIGSELEGEYMAAGIHSGCSDVELVGNTIRSRQFAVAFGGDPSRRVTIASNRILGGWLPLSNPDLEVVVSDNTRE